MSATQPILAFVGPTAVGKSSLALRVARESDGEIVNSDALQVYRGFDIGTAKPTTEEQSEIPHHLIDVLDPEERFSAYDFARRAMDVIREIQNRGRRPILVGGSGLYLRTLLDGISPIPDIDPQIRLTLDERLRSEGLAGLRAELQRLDPPTAERLEAADTQRIQRAVEVALGTGKPLSYWIQQPLTGGLIEVLGQTPIRIGLTLPRSILYDQIAGRVEQMLDEGWMDEVRDLLASGIDPKAPAFQAIGYRQLARYVSDGEPNGEDFGVTLTEIIRATRRYAKRQMTWFRKESTVVWLPASPGRAEVDAIVSARQADDLVDHVRNCSYDCRNLSF